MPPKSARELQSLVRGGWEASEGGERGGEREKLRWREFADDGGASTQNKKPWRRLFHAANPLSHAAKEGSRVRILPSACGWEAGERGRAEWEGRKRMRWRGFVACRPLNLDLDPSL